MPEDDGVLGNLPRSRPGRRSEKRDAGAPKPRSAARPKQPPAASGPPAPEPEGDPVTDALRMAGGLAAGGARVVQGVAREVLRRIPRP